MIRTYFAKRRLQRMVEQPRNSPEIKAFVQRRRAAIHGHITRQMDRDLREAGL